MIMDGSCVPQWSATRTRTALRGQQGKKAPMK